MGEYYCRKCSKRRKDSEKELWDDYLQNKKITQRMKKTLVEKYGVDNISKKINKMIKLKKEIVYMMVLSNSQVVKMVHKKDDSRVFIFKRNTLNTYNKIKLKLRLL
jgi:2-succinyl-5-enolpyruvyl-6-hydroxy-3-cyclohexene-1-carboxylate synthase